MKIKAGELRSLTNEELLEKLKEYKMQMLHLRQKRESGIIKPHELKEGRRNIAVIKTVMTEKKYEALLKEGKYKPKLSKKLRLKMTKEQLKKMKNGKTRMHRGMKVYAFVE